MMSTESSDDETMSIMEPAERNYRVLKKADILKYQQDDITLVSNTLSISTAAASILLNYYAWNLYKLQDAWFDDEDAVRKSVGLHNNPASGFCKSGELCDCDICVDEYVFDSRFEGTVGFCGHTFCTACLETYVSNAIDDGPGCLFLLCPGPSCRAAIGEDMVALLVSDEGKMIKYKEFLFRSYVDSKKNFKWCPSPDCEHVIEHQLLSESYDVTCDCSLSFCWNCLEDSHRPLDCETVAKWMLKNSSESKNVAWILANTKPCPFCNVPIERIWGSCDHMICLCGYEFCWTCNGPYKNHNDTGHKNFMRKSYDEKVKERAKRYSMKYVHYYERWAANRKSKEQAIKALAELREITEKQPRDLTYLKEGWEQIVECRRMLSWIYAYGYYLSEASLKKELLECLQGPAEVALESLKVCAETAHDKLKLLNLDHVTHEFDKIS